jgi:small-conductance mechanosensitive channel
MWDAVRRWLFDPTVERLAVTFIGVAVIITLVRVLSRSAGRYIGDTDARYRARKLVALAGYIAAALLVTTVYSSRLGSLTVAFGVAGAGIAFALQEVIVSVAGWVAVTFSRFYSPGDRVRLGDITGDVVDVGVLRTTLMEVGDWVNGDLYNGRIVRVANSIVFKQPVFNYSADFPFLWDEIRVPVRYGSDRAVARRLLEEATVAIVGDYTVHARDAWAGMLRRYRLEDARVDPMVTLVATDNWLDYTIRYVVDYRRRRTTKDMLFTKVLDAIDASGGRVALASATFELVAAPQLRVQLDDGSAPSRATEMKSS